MAKFKDSVVTTQGKALLFGDDKIIYTKAVLSSQDLSKTSVDDIRKMTSLSDDLKETPIGINKRGSGTVNVEAVFSNDGMTEDIDFNTVGWFAKPDGGQEILVSISPADGTQTLGAMTPGQQATDAIDLVLATAVGDSSKVDVVIDPAGQVTAAKLNSIINNLTVEFNQEITDAAKVKDFPTDVKSFDDLPDGYYHFSNLTIKQLRAVETGNLSFNHPLMLKAGLIRSITISPDYKIQVATRAPRQLWYRVSTAKKAWQGWYRFATNDDIDDLSKTITSNYNELSNTIKSNKEATDSSINTVKEELTTKIDSANSDRAKQVADINATISANKKDADDKISGLTSTVASNKADADKKINATNATVTANKTATDKAISDTNATVTANKKDADSKINATNATVTANKTATDKAISDTNATVTANKKDADNKISSLSSTVTANKKATDDALATKANTADVNKQISNINSTVSTNKADADKKISDTNATVVNNKKDADNKIASLNTTVANNKKATDSALATKANTADVYTKAQVDSVVKSAKDALNASISSTNGDVTNKLNTKANSSDLNSLKSIVNQPTLKFIRRLTKNDDIDKITQTGIYDAWANDLPKNNVTQVANPSYWTLVVYNHDNGQVFQWAISQPTIYYRWITTSNPQTSWVKMTTNSDLVNVQNTLQSKIDSVTNKANNAQNTANSVSSKVNIENALFRRITKNANWQDIMGSAGGGVNTNHSILASLRDDSSSGNTVGSNGSGIVFGGGDTHAVLSVGYGNRTARIAGGNGTAPVWHEDIAWKSDINSLNSNKADKSTTYTKTEVDNKVNAKANSSNVYTKAEVDSKVKNQDVYQLKERKSLGANDDANTILETGIYRISGNAIKNGNNMTWCFLIVLNWDNNTVQQYLVSGNTIYQRNISATRKSYPGWVSIRNHFESKTMTSLDVATATPTYEQTTTNGDGNFNRWLIDANVPIQIANYIKSVRTDLQNQINQAKSSGVQVQQFTDESKAKTWSSAGGSQLRIGLITS